MPINFRLPPREIKYIVDHSGARAVLVDESLAPSLDAVRAALDGVSSFILMSDSAREGYLGYEELITGASPIFEAPEISDDELLGLFYTSGPTAEPKGVVAHRTPTLARKDRRPQLGIWATTPARTILDCAPDLDHKRLIRLVADNPSIFSVGGECSTSGSGVAIQNAPAINRNIEPLVRIEGD